MATYITSDEEGQILANPVAKNSSRAAHVDYCTSDEESTLLCEVNTAKLRAPVRAKQSPVRAKQRLDSVKHGFETSEEEAVPEHTDVAKRGRGKAVGRVRKKPAAAKPEAKVEAKPCATATSVPTSSGAFDYARWASLQLSPTESAALAKDADLTIGSVCSGQSTESLAAEALSRCIPGFRVVITVLCESDPRKRKHLEKVHPSAVMVKDVAELKSELVKDAKGKLRDKPLAKVLFAGISCKCLSGLNRSPESVLGKGSTGETLRGLLNYVRSIPFESRPYIILLENVANMAKRREVEQGCKVAAQIVADLFDKLGYTAHWDIFNATDFFQPQSRGRLWMVMWRRPSLECSLQSHEKYAKVLQDVMSMIGRLKTQRHESLAVLLDRMQSSAKRVSIARESKEITEKAKKENDAYAVKNSLVIDIHDEAKFMSLVRPMMSKRASKVCYLKMAHAKKTHSWRWEEDLLVATVSQSVNWISVAHDCFPTLTPSGPFLVLHRGTPYQASGRLALAVQGVQENEAIFMKMADLPETLQQDLAGNAFSTNVCIALFMSSVIAHNAYAAEPVG